MTQDKQHGRLLINGWAVDLTTGESKKGEDVITLTPKSVEVLTLLVENTGVLVTTEKLIEVVWQGNEYVGKKGLANVIWQLRKQLGQDLDVNGFIKTVPKRGYQLILNCEFEDRGDAPSEKQGKPNITLLAVSCVAMFIALFVIAQFFMVSKPAEFRVADEKVLVDSESLLNHPAYNQDGTMLAFTKADSYNSHSHIWLKNLQSGAEEKISKAQADDTSPRWAKNSESLVFVRTFDDSTCQIVSVSLLSGKETVLDSCVLTETEVVDWSNNQQYLVYSKTFGNEQDGNNNVVLALYDMSQNSSQQLTAPNKGPYGDSAPSFSPDDQFIAFARHVDFFNHDIVIVNIKGEEVATIPVGAFVTSLDWLDDENLIVSADISGVSGLWTINIVSGKRRSLPVAGTVSQHINYNPARQVLVYAETNPNGQIMRVNLGAEQLEPESLSGSNRWNDFHFDIGPSGERMVFSSNRGGTSFGLYSLDLQSKSVTDLNIKGNYPSLSPDGRKVAYSGDCNPSLAGGSELCLADLVAESRWNLIKGEKIVPDIEWSQSGGYINTTVAKGSHGVHTSVNIHNTTQTSVCPEGAWRCFVDLSEGWVVYHDYEGQKLLLMTLEDNNKKTITDKLVYRQWNNWSLDHQGNVIFLERAEQMDTVKVFNVRSQEIVLSRSLPAGLVTMNRSIAYDPDNTYLYFINSRNQETLRQIQLSMSE